MSQGRIEITGTEFAGNRAGLFGGGCSLGDSIRATIRECRFVDNVGGLGGGLSVSSAYAWVDYNLFAGDSAQYNSGAVYFGGLAEGSFVGNTVYGNRTGSITGGVFFANAPVLVANNIVVANQAAGISCSGASPTLRYNDVWGNGIDYDGCSPGEGDVSADPLFVDPANLDFHLGLHSPAIDAGDTASVYLDPDGSRADMGMYGSHSFTMDQPSYPKNLSIQVIAGNVVLTWSPNPEADVAYYAVYRDTVEGFRPSAANFAGTVAAPDTVFTEPIQSATRYKICAVDTSGYASGYSAEVALVATGTPTTPVYRFALFQNVPNPFNPITLIQYELDRSVPVHLAIYDIQGRLVRVIVSGAKQGPGRFVARWDGRDEQGRQVSSGVYFYRLVAGDRTATRKMVLLK
jgi:hypothetical protein